MCKRKCNKHRVIAWATTSVPNWTAFRLVCQDRATTRCISWLLPRRHVCFLQLRKLCRHCRVAACQPLYRHVLCLVVGETEITVCTEQGISLERIEFLLEVCDVAVRAFDFAHSYTSSLVASSP